MTATDPYTLVLNELWAILESEPAFTESVRPGNRIKFTGSNRAPVKEQVSTADLPEVRIMGTGSQPAQRGSSSSVFDAMTFEVQVSSGDQRLDAVHLPVKWSVFRAFAKERVTLSRLQTLKWEGEKFVVNIKPTGVTEGVNRQDINRGITGWSAVWAIEVEMAFAHSAL